MYHDSRTNRQASNVFIAWLRDNDNTFSRLYIEVDFNDIIVDRCSFKSSTIRLMEYHTHHRISTNDRISDVNVNNRFTTDVRSLLVQVY